MRTVILLCALHACAIVPGPAFSQDATDETGDSHAPAESGVADMEADDGEAPSEMERQEPAVEKAEIELSPELADLRDRVRRCLAYYFYRPETTLRRSPWGVMHSVVGFGVDTPLRTRTREVNAIS